MKTIYSLLVLCLVVTSARAQTRDPDSYDPTRFEDEISAFEREEAVEPGSVLFVGSSSFRMWETLAEDFPGIPVVNRGFGGSQFEDVLHYLDRLVLRHRPRTVLVYEGDNDLAAGKSPERVLADFRTFVGRIHARLPKTRIGFVCIKPSPSRWSLAEQIRQANDLIRMETEGDSLLFFVDVFHPMLGTNGMPRRDLFLEDMLHMNATGYEIWQTAVARQLGEARPVEVLSVPGDEG